MYYNIMPMSFQLANLRKKINQGNCKGFFLLFFCLLLLLLYVSNAFPYRGRLEMLTLCVIAWKN